VTSYIQDKRVIQAFNRVDRAYFVPDEYKLQATGDYPLPIGAGQTISQPSLVAQMTELLKLKGEEKVLEIGTGSGYQAAILGKLCKQVITIERIAALAASAQKRLKRLGYKNVTVIKADGKKGYTKEAPYDAVIVTAAAREIPQALIDQLKPGGRLVIPFRGELIVIEKHGQVMFVPLVWAPELFIQFIKTIN